MTPPLPSEKDIKRRYGISLDQYVELLEAQGGVCAICRRPPRSGTLRVDHAHDGDLAIRAIRSALKANLGREGKALAKQL